MLFESQIHDLMAILPWVSVKREKEKMRSIDTQKRTIMTQERVKEESEKVVARIAELHHFKKAKTVMMYFPVHNEIDLRELLYQYQGEKTFLFPALTHHTHAMEARKFEPHTPFRKGRFGIPEPDTEAYNGHIDLIIVPGTSFDKHRRRLGRGGGYYDRFLKQYKSSFKVGVGYDFQIHHEIPHWLKDVCMDRVITPTRTI